MSNHSVLNDLGITNPEQIDRYSLQTIGNVDVLRVVYRRQKGSFRPDSKKFRFERREVMRTDENGQSVVDHEVAPIVTQAMAVLDPLVKAKHNREHTLELLHEELTRLEEEHEHRVAYIRGLLSDLSD
ncbi:MAG: DUF3461 family protein [Pseudomonadota bacterium]